MPSKYHRNRPEGLAHRAKLRRWIVPRLRPGCRIPSSRWLGRFLGVSGSQGYWHMRRVLHEAGVITEIRGRRIYVIALGAMA
jgi:DNA-binding transcriptional regulator YhcF (GntR family)